MRIPNTNDNLALESLHARVVQHYEARIMAQDFDGKTNRWQILQKLRPADTFERAILKQAFPYAYANANIKIGLRFAIAHIMKAHEELSAFKEGKSKEVWKRACQTLVIRAMQSADAPMTPDQESF